MYGEFRQFQVGKKLIDVNQTVALVDEDNEVQVFDSLSYAQLEIIDQEKQNISVELSAINTTTDIRIGTGLIRTDQKNISDKLVSKRLKVTADRGIINLSDLTIVAPPGS